jgi:hypothetical protein
LITFLAVLAVAAGTAGYVGTRSVLAGSITPNALGTSGPAATTAPPTTSTAGQGDGTPSTAVTTPPHTPTTPPPTQVPPGDPKTCPQATVDALTHAGLDSNLTVQLYIQVHRAGEYDSEIWVCQNATGLLVYQGHVMRGPLDQATSGNTLLLAAGIKGTVQLDGTNGYVASNPVNGVTTDYHVSALKLVTIKEPGNLDRQEYPAIVAYQP